MDHCLDADRLERLQRGQLTVADRTTVLAHLEDCPHCRRRLEDQRGDPRTERASVPPQPEGFETLRTLTGTEDADAESLETTGGTEPGPPIPETELDPDEPAAEAVGATTEETGDFVPTVFPERLEPADAWGTAAPSRSDAPPHAHGPSPTSQPSEYEILGQLGRGGMGVVYRARHRSLNRLVALKMILGGGQGDPDQLARFKIEAEAVARFRHPNIVQIYDIGEHLGSPYVSLELLEGGCLSDRLAGTPQPGPAAAALMATLATGIEAAHQAGVVHRDLKPSNILFTADGVPKIADFGLAKRLESEDGQTLTGQIMGTPSYMAPEQARGRIHEIQPATDVYALGAILYEMLTGRPPFKGPTAMETVRQVAEDDPVPPSTLQPRVSRDLETVCLKCLAKEPGKRYATARELAEDLQRYLDGQPVRARRTPAWERAAKWVRRHPTAATLILLAALATASAAGGYAWYDAREKDRQRKELAASAERERKETARVAGVRTQVDQVLFDGQNLVAQEKWDEARPVLTRVVSELGNEPRLGPERERAAGLLARADEGARAQGSRAAERQRYDAFRHARDEALFHETRFTGLDLPANQEATRRAARAALAIFNAPGSGGDRALGALPASLSDEDQRTVREGCYELLLILADAEVEPAEGLKDLDRAAALHPGPTRAYHLRRAACLARQGDGAEAAVERGRAEALAPVSAFDHFLTGQERYRRGDWTEALRRFDAALRLQPDHFWAHALAAICSLQLRRPAEAKAELNACLQREPGFAWLYVLRGFASAQIAELAGRVAGNLGAKGDALLPDIASQLDVAEADYAQALERLRDRPDDELNYVVRVNRGLLWLQRGAFTRAADDLQAAIRLNDRQYQAIVALAQVYQRQGRSAEAIEQFSRAIALRPDWAPLHRGRAGVALALRDATPDQRAAALRDLDTAIRTESAGNPVVALDQTNRARLLVLEGRETDALAACEAALKAQPDYPAAHLLRVRLLADLRRYDEAVDSCDAALAAGKPSAELYALRGLARAGRRDFAGAIEDDTQALALSPGSALLLTQRGWAYVLANAPELALRDFDQAIRLDPDAADPYNGRGTARVRLGKHREAVADAEAAVQRDGGKTARTLYNAARIHAQATSAAADEVSRTGRDAVLRVQRYSDRAVALVRAAAALQPPEHRAAFWRDQVMTDPALGPIRRRLKPDAPSPRTPSLSSSGG